MRILQAYLSILVLPSLLGGSQNSTLLASEIIQNWDSNLVSYMRLFNKGIYGFTSAASSNLNLQLQKQNNLLTVKSFDKEIGKKQKDNPRQCQCQYLFAREQSIPASCQSLELCINGLIRNAYLQLKQNTVHKKFLNNHRNRRKYNLQI